MAKLDVKKQFKTNNFKYGSYSAIFTAIVIAIVLAVNIVLGQMNNKFNLKLDLTKNKLYSLSDQSYTLLGKISSDITITGVYTKGKEAEAVSEILNKYKEGSSKIKVQYKDPLLSGKTLTKYSTSGNTVEEGTLIVESGNRFKVISPSDFYNYSYDSSGSTSVSSLAIEQKITAALLYVTSTTNPVVYNVEGQSEIAIPNELSTQLSDENFTVKNINLLTASDWKPGKNDIIMMISPQKDITTDELNKIKDFLGNGGRGLFIIDNVNSGTPNLKALLSYNALEEGNQMVVEGSTSNYALQTPYVLVPLLQSYDITSPLISKGLSVVYPSAYPLSQAGVKKTTQTVYPLLNSTTNSWGKVITANTTTTEKESGDITGPFTIGAAVTDIVDQNDQTKNTKVVVFTSSDFINSQFLQASSLGNLDLFMNSVNWLVDQKDNISIVAKDLSSGSLNITNQSQVVLISGITVILIPAIIFITGFVIWYRRKNL